MSDSEFDYSEADYTDDDDFGLDDGPDNGDNEIPEVDFVPHTTQELSNRMAGQSREIAEVLGISEQDTVTLLHHYSWNSEKLMDEYMAQPEEVLSKAGVSVSTGSSASGKRYYDTAEEFCCPICCDDSQNSYQLKCGHEFCMNCYSRYVDERVQRGDIIRCMSCDLALDHHDVDAISGKGVSSKLVESSIKVYVERHKTYKWCPSPDCGDVLEALDPIGVTAVVEHNRIPVAACTHGHQFCWSCGLENHKPSPCNATAMWVAKCKDDSETVKWISTNTKKCVKCETAIEKNGGCNHMTCKKCRHEFCWICLGDWKQHGTSYFQCNRFKTETEDAKKDGKKPSGARRSLQRYLHFYNHFSVHETSTKGDTKRCAEVEESVRLLQEASGISWIEAQFLAEAAQALLRTRQTLKWTYAFGYYCEEIPLYKLFEDVQARLSADVEALSKLFEIEEPLEIVGKKMEFMTASHIALESQKAMWSMTEAAVDAGILDLRPDDS